VRAAIDLIEAQKGVIAGIATIGMDDNGVTQGLRENYKCFEAFW